jgi:hypothetical protein
LAVKTFKARALEGFRDRLKGGPVNPWEFAADFLDFDGRLSRSVSLELLQSAVVQFITHSVKAKIGASACEQLDLPSVFEQASCAYPDTHGNYAMPQHCTRTVLRMSIEQHEMQMAGHQASVAAEMAMIAEMDSLGVPEDMTYAQWRRHSGN